MTFDPNVKLVDLYLGGEWKCKLEYVKKISGQDDNHMSFTWVFNGVKFYNENNPGPEMVARLQSLEYPLTVADITTKIEI